MSDSIAIIGTAGRGTDASHINGRLYDAMYEAVCSAIDAWKVSSAVSGGAAVADHLAVRAFLDGKVSKLTLYLPARFENRAFVPNPAIRFNPGQTANRYHRAFSEACGINSLAEIDAAIRKGAKAVVIEGFKKRNLEVAATCSHMVALTFGGISLDDHEDSWKEFTPSDEGFTNSSEAGLKDGGTAFHGSAENNENRRKCYQDFLPGDAGFTKSVTAGLRDGGTAHTWNEAWRPKIKRHVNVGMLLRCLSHDSVRMKKEEDTSEDVPSAISYPTR